MATYICICIPPKVIYLIKKLHMDDAVCGAIGIDKKISSTVHVRGKRPGISALTISTMFAKC